MTTLFLYGTLKRGQRNHFRMAGQQFVGPARTLPHYRLYDCGPYPGLVHDLKNGVSVTGEFWQVDDEALRRLDEFEGAPLPDKADPEAEFVRDLVQVEGHPGPIFAYYYRRDVSRLRDCGESWPAGGLIAR